MATITFTCEHCRKTVEAPAEAAGKRGKCPYCHETSYIPDPSVSEEDEIPLAPLDEEEERQRQREIAELRRQEEALLRESGDETVAEPEVGGRPGAGTTGKTLGSDYKAEDLYGTVNAYCIATANSQLERAQSQARRLRQYGYTGIQAVEDFLSRRASTEQISDIPDKLANGILKKLRDELKKAQSG
ncbi:MAG: hypothetical protein ACLFUJ_11545 [Phycisphaerae bacterium]